MKSLFLSLLAFMLSLPVFPQVARQDYFRFHVGTDFTDAYGVDVEYGMSFLPWLETGLSLGVYNSLPLTSDNMGVDIQKPDDNYWTTVIGDPSHYDMNGKLNLSLLLKNRVDVVRLFAPQSRHGVKVGVGLGISYYHHMTNAFNLSEQHVTMRHDMDLGFDYSLMAAYEFALTPKLSLGASFEYTNVPELGIVGVYVKRYF